MSRPTWLIKPIPRDIKLGLKVLHVMNHREANFSATGLNCLETEYEDTGLSSRLCPKNERTFYLVEPSWILISLIELAPMVENMNPLVFGSQPSSRGSLLKELCLKAPIHRVNSMGLGIAEKDRLNY